MTIGKVVIVLAQRGIPARQILEQFDSYARGELHVVSILPQAFANAATYMAFMRMTRAEQRAEWTQACGRIHQQIRCITAPTIAVVVDGHYFAFRECFSVVDVGELVNFRPAKVVTLIDDVYDVVARVRMDNVLDRDDRATFSLVDALIWRRGELALGDHLCAAASCAEQGSDSISERRRDPPHFVIAVKHPSTFIERVVTSGVSARYLSFPISRTRGVPSLYNAVQRHRRRVVDCLDNVLDPITIDERRFTPRESSHPSDLSFRWDLQPVQPAVGPASAMKEVTFSVEELAAAKPLVMGDLRSRAYRYVEQAEAIIVFRPFLASSTIHRGVEGEIRLAVASGKRTVAYEPTERGLAALHSLGVNEAYDDEDAFYAACAALRMS